MTRYVFTDPQLEALKIGFEAGAGGLEDHRWAAVQLALTQPPPAGRGAVEIVLDESVEDDLRTAFAAGYAGIPDDAPGAEAVAGAMAGVAEILEVDARPGFGM